MQRLSAYVVIPYLLNSANIKKQSIIYALMYMKFTFPFTNVYFTGLLKSSGGKKKILSHTDPKWKRIPAKCNMLVSSPKPQYWPIYSLRKNSVRNSGTEQLKSITAFSPFGIIKLKQLYNRYLKSETSSILQLESSIVQHLKSIQLSSNTWHCEKQMFSKHSPLFP